MINKGLIVRLFDAASIQRWNDHVRPVEFTELVASAQAGGLFGRVLPEEGEPDRAQRSAFSRMLTRYHRTRFAAGQFHVDGKGHQRRFRVEQVEF